MADNYFQKTGHDIHLKNQVFMNLPLEAHGMYSKMRYFYGPELRVDGTFPLGAKQRATLADLLLFFGDGTKKRRDELKSHMDGLVLAGVVKLSGKSNTVVLCTAQDEQELGRNRQTYDKRDQRAKVFYERVERIRRRIVSYVKADNGSDLGRFRKWVCCEVDCKGRTADRIMQRLVEDGVIEFDIEQGVVSFLSLDGTLATLARPPVAGAGKAGSGQDQSSGHVLQNQNQKPEPERERGYSSPQLKAGQLGRGPNDSGESPGASPPGAGRGASERSEDNGGPPVDPSESRDWMYQPGDAYSVPDPVHAAIIYLRTKPGWQERSGQGKNDASSRRILLAKWTALKNEIGPEAADMMWRDHLRDIFEDGYDKTWNSFIKIFISRLNKAMLHLPGGR